MAARQDVKKRMRWLGNYPLDFPQKLCKEEKECYIVNRIIDLFCNINRRAAHEES